MITNAKRAASLASRPIQLVTLTLNQSLSKVGRRALLWLFGVKNPDTNVLAVREEIAGALKIGHSKEL